MAVSGIVAGLIGLVVLLACLWLTRKFGMRHVAFSRTPDTPKSFGYKMSWLAVRTEDTDALVSMLGLVAPEEANWNSGIGAVYNDDLSDHRVFVTPAVDGWSFVVGLSIPHPVSERLVDKLTPMLVNLGNRFGDVQYFFSYPSMDFFAWARGTNGRVVRAFAICDEGITWNRGRISKVEKKLGLKLFELRGVGGRRGDAGGELILYPTEAQVMRVARSWSLDPSRLEETKMAPALGILGIAPAAWRAKLAERDDPTSGAEKQDDCLSAA